MKLGSANSLGGRFEVLVFLAALGLVGCLESCQGQPIPAEPRLPVQVEFPACPADAAPDRPESTPSCAALAVVARAVDVPVVRLATVYDGYPLAGRSWRTFATSAWGQSPASDGVSAPALSGLPTLTSTIRAVASRQGAEWSSALPEPRGRADTRADEVMRELCIELRQAAPAFDAAVLLFDHVVDTPPAPDGGGPATQFANETAECLRSNLVVELVAQPGALRYAYVVGRNGTGNGVATIAERIAQIWSSPREHTNSPNMLMREDSSGCTPGPPCPRVTVIPLSDHRFTRPVVSTVVSATRAGWDTTRRIERNGQQVSTIAAGLPAPLNPDAFLATCAEETLVAANSPRPGANEDGLLAALVSSSVPVGVDVPVPGYEYVTQRTTVHSSFELEEESAWRAMQSASVGLVTSGDVNARDTVVECRGERDPRVAWSFRVESERAALVMMRWPRGDAALPDLIRELFPEPPSEGSANDWDPDLLGEWFGWQTAGARVQASMTPARVEWRTSAPSLDCATRTLVNTLVVVQEFGRDDFRARVCSDEAKHACPALHGICGATPPEHPPESLHWDLLNAPAVLFDPTNEDAPDSARSAVFAVAQVVSAAAQHLLSDSVRYPACRAGALEWGCLRAQTNERSPRTEPIAEEGSSGSGPDSSGAE